MTTNSTLPFLKWAGGKRQLLNELSARLPQNFNTYYEPFVGGGALLFYLKPKLAIINDINMSLINAYRQIQLAPEELITLIDEFDCIPEDAKSYYYHLRDRYNTKIANHEYDLETAALLIFLNKHCFNGLYRVNSKGLFNVPFNNSKAKSIDENNIYSISEYLQGITILQGDFEKACDTASKGDFIFLDSPYAPLNDTSFEAYTKEGFAREEHIRLAKLFDNLTDRGCYCMLTNHNTELINELYSNKNYRMDIVSVRRSINSNANKRTGEEIIICNY